MNQPSVCPPEGQAGEFKMQMYRGKGAKSNDPRFASDPGDYGRGTYYAGSKEFAAFYGTVTDHTVELANAFRPSIDQLRVLIEEYRTCKMQDGRDARFLAAQRLTDDMKAQGYDGLVVFGYETFEEWSACVF